MTTKATRFETDDAVSLLRCAFASVISFLSLVLIKQLGISQTFPKPCARVTTKLNLLAREPETYFMRVIKQASFISLTQPLKI